jgi:hypothetical protein
VRRIQRQTPLLGGQKERRRQRFSPPTLPRRVAAASRIHNKPVRAACPRRRLREVARHAGADAAGGEVGARLRDDREAGLEARHGAAVVQAVQHLVVEHDLGLVLGVGDGVPHVLAG